MLPCRRSPRAPARALLTFLRETFPRVVFSAARPNQGGRLHVNEQPAACWIRRFQRLGFELSPSNETFRSAINDLAIPWWYKANINVFQRV